MSLCSWLGFLTIQWQHLAHLSYMTVNFIINVVVSLEEGLGPIISTYHYYYYYCIGRIVTCLMLIFVFFVNERNLHMAHEKHPNKIMHLHSTRWTLMLYQIKITGTFSTTLLVTPRLMET